VSRPSRILIAARWPVGVLVTGWTYMWRTTPMYRREVEGSWDEDAPPEVAPDVDRTAIQESADGAGPQLHRRYHTRIADSRLDAVTLMARISADPQQVAPGALARFTKDEGEEGRMAVGDEWTVHMPGPWDGPIRVVDVTPTSFRFATLEGHLEAGQIEWHAWQDGDEVVFGIESWARSGDRLSDVMHNRLRMAKEVQLHMWSSVIERVVGFAGGRMVAGIDIETRRVDPEAFPATVSGVR
jgi:Domain of unknown function (DUF1990)